MKTQINSRLSLPLFFLIIFYHIFSTQACANDENLRKAGDLGRFLIPTSAFLMTVYEKDFPGTKSFVLSLGGSLFLTQALKQGVNEMRPNDQDKSSFPSGHAVWAFSGATFLHRRYGLSYALPAYAGAIFVGYTRVKNHKHEWHDVIAGAGVAGLNTLLFTKAYQWPIAVSISPHPNKGIIVSATIVSNKC